MAQFPLNPTRIDPYKNFKFRLVWDDEGVKGPIAGVSKVSGLKRTDRAGHASRRRRPLDQAAFARRVDVRADHDRARDHPRPRVREMGDQGLFDRRRRRDVAAALPQGHHHRALQSAGREGEGLAGFPLLAVRIHRGAELDANANAVAFETIVLQNEGFARDEAVVETPEF
jgi:hypothetical protein